jgi:hypothetical protein
MDVGVLKLRRRRGDEKSRSFIHEHTRNITKEISLSSAFDLFSVP